MATLNFYLKNPKAKNETLVYLFFQYGYYVIDPLTKKKKYKALKMSTGESIDPDYWNKATGRARETKKFSQHPEFNARLKKLENTVFTIYRKFINDDEFPSPPEIKEKVLAEINSIKVEKLGDANRIGFIDFAKQVIEDTISGKRLTENGTRFSLHTYKGYITTLNHLVDFENERGKLIDFESINLDFYNQWVDWFYKKNMSLNSVGKYVKILKVFMSEALEKGITKNIAFKHKKFKVLEEFPETYHLSDEELEKILELDLSDNGKLDKARDMFLLDCYLGLRIADFEKLKRENVIKIDNVNCVKSRTQKTGETVIIPLKKNALWLLDKYNYELPQLIAEGTMNKLIKKIGKLAGIDDKVQVTKTIGGISKTKTFEKYKLLGNHTARRSFATNYYNATKDSYSVMKITGHKTEQAFLRYIRTTKEQNAVRLAAHPYFNE